MVTCDSLAQQLTKDTRERDDLKKTPAKIKDILLKGGSGLDQIHSVSLTKRMTNFLRRKGGKSSCHDF